MVPSRLDPPCKWPFHLVFVRHQNRVRKLRSRDRPHGLHPGMLHPLRQEQTQFQRTLPRLQEKITDATGKHHRLPRGINPLRSQPGRETSKPLPSHQKIAGQVPHHLPLGRRNATMPLGPLRQPTRTLRTFQRNRGLLLRFRGHPSGRCAPTVPGRLFLFRQSSPSPYGLTQQLDCIEYSRPSRFRAMLDSSLPSVRGSVAGPPSCDYTRRALFGTVPSLGMHYNHRLADSTPSECCLSTVHRTRGSGLPMQTNPAQ